MKFFVIFILLSLSYAPLLGQTKESPLKVGDPAPVFSLPDLQNNYIFLRDYSGQKLRKPWKNKTKYVIVLSFFATWCAPCKREIPYLEKLQTEFSGKEVKFFLVDVGEERDVLDGFLEKNKIPLTILHDRYQQTAEKFGATSLPRLIVIDKEGTVQLIKKGFKDGDSFMKEMSDLLNRLLS
jgi:thiol-disulfide isomerase/thioredoxin